MTTPADAYITLMDWHMDHCARLAQMQALDAVYENSFISGAVCMLIEQRQNNYQVEQLAMFIKKIVTAWDRTSKGLHVSDEHLAIDPQTTGVAA